MHTACCSRAASILLHLLPFGFIAALSHCISMFPAELHVAAALVESWLRVTTLEQVVWLSAIQGGHSIQFSIVVRTA
ncbi:hypothetical protein V8C35DRAFT_314634 [Trichoderma chlorosporum]